MSVTIDVLTEKLVHARLASRAVAQLPTKTKNSVLNAVADALETETDYLVAENSTDVAAATEAGVDPYSIDRLTLSQKVLAGMAADVRKVAALEDPVGAVTDMRTVESGITVGRIRVPFGVVGAIYESRPNVTVDIACLCFKSGNAVVLRGGSEAIYSNVALARVIHDAGVAAGAPEHWVQLVEDTDRALVHRILQAKGEIDLVIPRGGAGLINFVVENATVPVIETGAGVCHTYVDADADLEKAQRIVVNAKTRRYSICNALDTLLVHAAVAPQFLSAVFPDLVAAGVEIHGCPRTQEILGGSPHVLPAIDDDWGKEFLALIMAVKVVADFDAAMEHLHTYTSSHSEAIVTQDYSAGQRFMQEVDAAAVYWNASTQFTDGAQFGLGAEVGISTQKLHARGPMALEEMTTYKWIVYGDGAIRPL
ncbi:MAG: glutamate-5-semialdehyde dehydrogenase [Chloroflexota bacterium]|nr:glutamate-5-semialdehyde dehydrogenase [Chloroflexota bacterium]MDE2931458.1 glutamate-5-semialdehyde dehydrogenase [Chloroflexota bacterium]